MNPSPQIAVLLRVLGAVGDVLRKKNSAGGAGYRQAVRRSESTGRVKRSL